jgi:uncharacterized membrane protein YeaQ/YmgE (transglycosylase-associated protein family)
MCFGALAGLFAQSILPGPRAGGRLADAFIGGVAGLLGGLIGVWTAEPNQLRALDGVTLLLAIWSALMCLFLYRGIAMRLSS